MSATPFTVDLAVWLNRKSDDEPAVLEQARGVADSFYNTGVCVVRDPRAREQDNDEFVDLMEDYFDQPLDVKMRDVRADLSYQVGPTPENVEVPRCAYDPDCIEVIRKQDDSNRAHFPQGPDHKWRYFWRIGERPANTKYAEMNAANVVPAAFPKWTETMNRWGSILIAAVRELSQLAAIGMGLPRDTFLRLLEGGPHLLAPTGSDLNKYNKLETIFAGFHTDLNFMTIHGKSRYPGLFIWLRDGSRVPVVVPDGCLLVQAGQQFQYLTGGRVLAGWHEVIVTEKTLEAVERQRAKGRPVWRVSSTLFSHVASDFKLQPVGHFAQHAGADKYPPIDAGLYVAEELKRIRLHASVANDGKDDQIFAM